MANPWGDPGRVAGPPPNPEQITPVRNPGIINRIANLLFRSDPGMGPQPTQQQTTESGVTVKASQTIFEQFFRSSSDRLAIYQDVEEMDSASEEVSVALDTIADNVCSSEDGTMMSFEVQSEDEQVDEILQQVCKDADLQEAAYSITRNLIKYGDSFSEIVVNGDGQVVDVKQLPPSTMFRNQDSQGRLLTGAPQYTSDGSAVNGRNECAFDQIAEDTQTIVAAFWPWQIAHGRLNWDGFSPYGRSHLRVTRIIWKKLKAIDEALIIARLARAYPKYKYSLDATGLSPAEREVELTRFANRVNQRQAIDGRREQPYSILSDIFFTKNKIRDNDGKFQESSTDVQILESNGQTVYNISDISDYLHRKLLTTLRVPPAHMGWEQQVNARATLSAEDVQYIRYLRRVQGLVSSVLHQIFDTALVLAGMDPDEKEYEVVWPPLSTGDDAAAADSEFSRAQADQIYSTMGAIDSEWVQKSRFDMSDEEIAEIQDRVKEKAEQDQANAIAQKQAAAPPPQPTSGEKDAENAPSVSVDGGDDGGDASGGNDDGDDMGQEFLTVEELGNDPELVQAYVTAARQVAAKQKHVPMTGTHTHMHVHQNGVIHTHAHSHSGGASHAHSHGKAHVNAPVLMDQSGNGHSHNGHGRDGSRESVAMLAEIVRRRTETLLQPDMDRILRQQREGVAETRQTADRIEIRSLEQAGNAGNPAALIQWFNDGAGGQISWGARGDFEQCVQVAAEHVDDPEGFCNLRHQDAVGVPPGQEGKGS